MDIWFAGNTNFLRKEDGYISAFIAKKVDGIILASVQSRYSNAYDLFKKYDVPYVLVDRDIRHSNYDAGFCVQRLCAVYRLRVPDPAWKHGNRFYFRPGHAFHVSGPD